MSERGSSHHSARLDDAMRRETESLVRGSPVEARAEEWRQMEGPAEGEPAPDAHISTDDVELRSLLAVSLRPSAFPATRSELLTVALEEHAEGRVLEWLNTLPDDSTFATVEQVWAALGGRTAHRGEPVIATPRPAPREPVRGPEPTRVHEPAAAPPSEPRAERVPVLPRDAPPQPGPSRATPSLATRGRDLVVGTVEMVVDVAVAVVRRVRHLL